MDHYQLLGVPRNCDRAALHKAFRDISKKNHPDRFPDEKRSDAEKQYQRIVIAFNTLKDPRLRSAYDRKLSAGQLNRRPAQQQNPEEAARKYLDMGVQNAKAERWEQAVECFKRANHYKPDAEGFFQQAQAESHVKNLFKNAVENFQKCIQMQPKALKYYLGFIEALRRFGLNARARTVLDKAVELFPQSEELLAIGRELEPKKYKAGLLGGLFKR